VDPGLVGRQHEVRHLRRLLSEPLGSNALIAGPAGVGKSRLAEEVAETARSSGWTVLRARGSRAAATIPLGAFAHLLPSDLGVAGSRLELLHGAVRHLAELAEGVRLLVVIDDAHHLDGASATLTYLLATASPAVTLLTVRTEESSPDPIAALWLEGHADRVELASLSREETDLLAETLLVGPVDRATLAELWRLTRGNALLTVEVLRAARVGGAWQQIDGLWHHSGPLGAAERLAAVIDSRLAHLSAADRAALELLAVGEPVPMDVLDRAVGADRVAVLEQGGLVEVSAEVRPAVVRTRHPLYGEVLRDRMPRARVRTSARLLADTLDGLGATRREDVFRLALWRLEAGDLDDPEALTDAARQAVTLFEHDLALRLAQAAIDAGVGARARLCLAEALAGLGRVEEAESAFAAIDTTDHPEVIVPRAWNLAMLPGNADAALALLKDAADRAGDVEVADEVRVAEATLRSFLGDQGGALELAQRVLERAGASDRVLVQALTITTAASALHGRPVTALADIERGLDLVARADDAVPMAEMKLRVTRALALDIQGALRAAEHYIRPVYLDALDRNAWHEISTYGAALSHLLLSRGRIAECARVAAESAFAAERADPLAVGPSCVGLRALALAQSGDLAGAQAILDEHDRLHPHGHRLAHLTARARAWVAAQEGRTADAVALADRAGRELRAAGLLGWAAVQFHDVVRFGAPEVVVEGLADLAAEVEGPLVDALAAHAAAAAHGRADDLAAVAGVLAELGADLIAAELYTSVANAYRRSSREEDARRADRRSRNLGRGCIGARTPGLGTLRAKLTARQLEVAVLAASGLTNRKIAERLRISSRTVDNHLAQVYASLGIAGRGELKTALRGDSGADGGSAGGLFPT